MSLPVLCVFQSTPQSADPPLVTTDFYTEDQGMISVLASIMCLPVDATKCRPSTSNLASIMCLPVDATKFSTSNHRLLYQGMISVLTSIMCLPVDATKCRSSTSNYRSADPPLVTTESTPQSADPPLVTTDFYTEDLLYRRSRYD